MHFKKKTIKKTSKNIFKKYFNSTWFTFMLRHALAVVLAGVSLRMVFPSMREVNVSLHVYLIRRHILRT
jgi:hypothetical protein